MHSNGYPSLERMLGRIEGHLVEIRTDVRDLTQASRSHGERITRLEAWGSSPRPTWDTTWVRLWVGAAAVGLAGLVSPETIQTARSLLGFVGFR